MASANNLPDFETILQRGAVTEPRALSKTRRDDNKMSLNAAVESAKRERRSTSSKNKRGVNEKSMPLNKRAVKLKQDESVFSSDSSSGMPRRHHTPSTLPRTKFTAATPVEQKLAIMELRQKLGFDDEEAPEINGPAKEAGATLNNEGFSITAEGVPDNASVSSAVGSVGPAGSHVGSEISESVDVNKIMTRLTQVREYLQQATAMYDSLSSSDTVESSKAAQMGKLATLVKQLRIQEQGYIDLLQRTLVVDSTSEMTDVTPSGSQMSLDVNKEESLYAQADQLKSLQQQQDLLKKIIEQQKQLAELKKRQSTLLAMQAQAERLVIDAQSQASTKASANTQRQNNQAEPQESQYGNPGKEVSNPQSRSRIESAKELKEASQKSDEQPRNQKFEEIENGLDTLINKKEEMERLISVLKGLKESHNVEASMMRILGQSNSSVKDSTMVNGGNGLYSDHPSSYISESASDIDDSNEKLRKLAEVRERLDELRAIVAEYERTGGDNGHEDTSRDNRLVALNRQPVSKPFSESRTFNGGARPKDPNRGMRIKNLTKNSGNTATFPNYGNPAASSSGRGNPGIDVTWNARESKDQRSNTGRTSGIASKNIDFNTASKSEEPDLLSKIGHLQEARDRLVSFQAASSSAVNNAYDNIFDLGKVQIKPQAMTAMPKITQDAELASVSSRSASINELDWQDDPELVEKIKKLQIAKEKLKKLQELVSVIQQDTMPSLPVSDLLELSFNTDGIGSSKGGSNDDESDTKQEDSDVDDVSEERSDISEHQSQTSLPVEGENDADGEEGDSASITGILNNQQGKEDMYEAEAAYQEKRKLQREELDKLLRERQKLIEVQQQLSDLNKKTHVTAGETQTFTARDSTHTTDTRKQEPIADQEKTESPGRHKPFISLLQQPRITYKGTGTRSRLFKRSSNMSVEPQVGSRGESEQSYSPRHSRSVDTLPSAPLPNNPLIVSELRRQRDMFEQKKKQRFAEKHQMKQISDNASEGGTFSIRSDIDEGVGVSMLSAEVTTATWGGSTEQSSTEEDSAVGEDEEREMDGAYEDSIPQPEEEEEEEEEDDPSVREDAGAPLYRPKCHPRKTVRRAKFIGSWSDSDKPAGKKRKLSGKKNDFNRSGGTVSWAMNASPRETRSRPRQQNVTPAHRIITDQDGESNSPLLNMWEQQCQHLHQQLSSNTSLTGSLLRNQQTLLAMLQSQINPGIKAQSIDSPIRHLSDAFGPATFQQSFNHGFEDRLLGLVQSVSACQTQLSSQQQQLRSLQAQFQNQSLSRTADPREKPPSVPLTKDLDNTGQNVVHFGHTISPGGTVQPCQPNGKTPTRTVGIQSREKTPYPTAKKWHSTTQEVNTQTDTSLFDDQFHFQHHDYSLFGGKPPDEDQSKITKTNTSFSPFRFYATSELPSASRVEDETAPVFPNPHADTLSRGGGETSSYNPLSYSDTAPLATSTNTTAVVASSSGSPSKSLAMATLAGRQKSIWPSFLANSTEKTENVSDGSSIYTSSFPGKQGSSERLEHIGKEDYSEKPDEKIDKVSDTTSNFSLFEALRDSIYSEVATLISMNETRPHYLIELFRELQLLTSDYLRQRALYALQDLVTRYLTDENLVSDDNANQGISYKKWTPIASEHTPSESLVTSDDEEQRALEALSSQIKNSDIYDYAESAENGSTLSTPTSSADHPFARDQLGDTVINLDEALQKMKMYEESMSQTQRALGNMSLGELPGSFFVPNAREKLKQAIDAMSTSSAGDFASETSSDVPQASIDTQKLDKQIKTVVMELVPFFNERTETTVTTEFLEEMKNLILTLARQKEPQSEREEFGRFFHKQLESILYDSLMKFTGKKLNECGEDIITDVSEILFNELAFFKLMQDLDRTPRRSTTAAWAESNRVVATNNDLNNGVVTFGSGLPPDREDLVIQDYETSETSSLAPDVELVHNLQDGSEKTEGSEENRGDVDNGVDQPDRTEDSEDEAESSRQYVKLELSVSESRPVNSTGSGEEDLEEEQPTFSPNRGNASRSSPCRVDNDADESQTESQGEDTRPESDGAPEDQDPAQVDGDQGIDYGNVAAEEDEREENARDMEDFVRECSEEETAHVDGDVEGASGGHSGASAVGNNTNEIDVDDSEVTIDDLPIKLTGLTEADLQARIASEQEQNDSPAGLLSNFDGIDGLAAAAVREPGGHVPNGYPDDYTVE